jgi:hypothetical protein
MSEAYAKAAMGAVLFGGKVDKKHDRAIGYIVAQRGIETNTMTTVEAIGRVARDGDWIAECELTGRNPVDAARDVVAAWQAKRWAS